MNETIKKLTDEVVKEIAARVAQPEIQKAITKTKESKGSGQFRVVISTDDLDRHGESVDQNGLDISRYMENPIVLWAHDHWSMPVGVTEKITQDTINRDGKPVKRTIAEGYFVDGDINPMGPQLARAYEAKVLTKTSIGFIVKEMLGNAITKSELLEFSFVPIPANPYTENLLKANALDMAALKSAGVISELKEGETVENGDPEPAAPAAEPAEAPETAPGSDEKPETTETPAEPAPEAPAADHAPAAEPAAPAGSENPEDPSPEAEPGAETPGEKSENTVVEKAGRTISAANEKKLNSAADLLSQAAAAIKEVLSAVDAEENSLDPSKGEQPQLEKTEAPIQKVETLQPGELPELKSLDDFLAVRDLLRVVETAARRSLGTVNQKIKEIKSNK